MTLTTPCRNDDAFGPTVEGCRGDFDFTQKFERIFFAIIPASIYITLATVRLAVLAQRRRVVGGSLFQYTKLAVIALYSALLLPWLVLAAKNSHEVVHALSVAAATSLFIASLFTGALSYAEHSRSRRPSSLIGAYVFLTLLFDIVQTRTFWLLGPSHYDRTVARLLTASIALKAIILCLESVSKNRWIHWIASEHSPEESSGIFSLGVFFWLYRLFLRGYKNILAIDQLYPLDPDMRAETLYRKLASKMRVHRYRDEPKFGLFKDLFRALAGPLLLPIAPRAAMIGFTYCQPFLINTMLSYLDDTSEYRRDSLGYGLIGASAIIYTGIAVSQAFFDYYTERARFITRGALVSVIYHKTAEMKLTEADDASAVTLMSTDIQYAINGVAGMYEPLANTIEVAVGSWLLHDKLGVAFVAPLGVIILCAAALAGVTKLVKRRQGAWMAGIQKRVGLTASVISSMKLYKISGIAGPIANLIQSLRVKELKFGNQFRTTLIFAVLLAHVPLTFSPVITFAATSRYLSVSTLFTSFAYISLVTNPLANLFQRIPSLLSSLTCLERIQKFVVAEPQRDYRQYPVTEERAAVTELGLKQPGFPSGTDHAESETRLAFSVEQGNFGWGGEKHTLTQINVGIPANALTLVVGPVASGKSTFCKVLLGEIPQYDGVVKAYFEKSSLGYCEQTPFLYNDTLKNNIIGHCTFNQQMYDEVINATLLSQDISLLPQGHDTKIGSNGIMLSGGQKQRVSVARALYSDAKVMIFDDVLSGLDANTEAELFRRVFGPEGLVRKRAGTAIVCTHSVWHLSSADHIIALESGTVIEEGNFEDLLRNQSYIHSLGIKAGTTSSSASSDREVHAQDVKDEPSAILPPPKSETVKTALDDRSRQMGDWSVYGHYFRNTRVLTLVAMLVSGLILGFCENFGNIWLNYWSQNSFGRGESFYIGIYALLNAGTMASLTVFCFECLISMTTFAGSALHQRTITTVVTAPLAFFSTTDSGIVVNLFSQDMTLIDTELPSAVLNFAANLFSILGECCVVASASPYLAVAYPFLFGIIYMIQKFYLRTSRQMRLLDLEAKSPMYTHFLDTIKGIATIRAFGWTAEEIDQSIKLLNTSQRPAYLLAVIQRWLMATTQLVVALLAVGLVSLATQLRTNAGLTGASLVTLLQFGATVSSVIMSYTSLETSIGAVARLRTFSNIVKSEDQPDEDQIPPESWPSGGRIDIQDVSASYQAQNDQSKAAMDEKPSADLVIKDLTLTVQPGQKVAVCGRTGSGKSSLMLLLLRLLDPLPRCAENMEIDEIPVHKIDRATMRERIIAIPQDAIFLPDGSSIKSNLDPLDLATEAECLSALEAVRLRHFYDEKGSLQASVHADELSAGQKQLFSLGRAVLRKRVRDRRLQAGEKEAARGGILLLDEVSSSVDQVTDRAMQKIIQEEFETYTIVMVSHRLEMVVTFFDRVLILDQGSLVEDGNPKDLVNMPESQFGKLWALANHGSETL